MISTYHEDVNCSCSEESRCTQRLMLSESAEWLWCQRSHETDLHLLSIECVAVCDDVMDDEHVNL